MPLVQLIGSPAAMDSVGMETELSRLRDLKAQLELDKLQHDIRELGGDPSTPTAADLPDQAAKSNKTKRGSEARAAILKPRQSSSPGPHRAKRARPGQKAGDEQSMQPLSPMSSQPPKRGEQQTQTSLLDEELATTPEKFAFYVDWAKELDKECIRFQYQVTHAWGQKLHLVTHAWTKLRDPRTGRVEEAPAEEDQEPLEDSQWEWDPSAWDGDQWRHQPEVQEQWSETPTEWDEQAWGKAKNANGRFLSAVPPATSEKKDTICKFQHQKAGCQHGQWCNFLHDHRWRKCFMEAKRPGNCQLGEACRFSHATQPESPARSPCRGRSPTEASQSSKEEGKEGDPDPVDVQDIFMGTKTEPDSEEPVPPPSSKPRPGATPTAPEVPAPTCASGNGQGSGVGIGVQQRPESLGQAEEKPEKAGRGSDIQQHPLPDEQHYNGHHRPRNGGKPIGSHGETRASGQVKAEPRATFQSNEEKSRPPSGGACEPPKGLIKTLEANGIVASAEGGWKRCGTHHASQAPDEPSKGQSPDFEAEQDNEFCQCEGEPHILQVLLPNILRQLYWQGWVGWKQLYVEAKMQQAKHCCEEIKKHQSAQDRRIEAPPPTAGKHGVGGPEKKARGRPHQSKKG